MKSLKRFHILVMFMIMITAGTVSAATDTAVTENIPWSGYWWPTKSGGLSTGIGYRGHPAPLEKYDLYKNGSYPGPATQWDLDNSYDPDAPSWYGLCGAWAAASAYEAIAFYPSVIDNIVFHVGDKKGLMTALHELSWEIGIRETVDSPEILHRWLLQYIKSLGVAFYAELEPNEEVWNYPVYRYEMNINDSGSYMDVACTIWYADDQVDPDFQGTQSLTKSYTYRLLKSGDAIIGGEWTGASIATHPSQVVMPTYPKARNPYLDYDFIRSIAVSVDDELESDQASELHPGGYNLILLDRDEYRLNVDAGDTAFVRVAFIEGLNASLRIEISDGLGNIVKQATVVEETEIQFECVQPPYLIAIDSDDYGGGGVYRIEYDLKKRFEFANHKIQKGFGWGGVALVNSESEACDRIYVVGYTSDGRPIQTYMGPFSLAANEKKTFFTADLKSRAIEKSDLYGIRVIASSGLNVVNLTGYNQRNMSCYAPDVLKTRMIVPDTVASWDTSKSVSWGLYNPNILPSSLLLRLVNTQGDILDEVELDIPANGTLHYSKTQSPFATTTDNGWILVQTDNANGVQGYIEWLEQGISKAEALRLLDADVEWVLPHVARTDMWKTSLTLINASERTNTAMISLIDGQSLQSINIALNAYEKQTIDLSDRFGDISSADFNQSAILIQADDPVSGYYCYDTPGDYMCFPLTASAVIDSQTILPHVATGSDWWTGVNLFNPSPVETVHIQLDPYDFKGQRIETEVLNMDLAPWKKSVFTVQSLFGAMASDFAFIKISVQEGGGLNGSYGIGNPECSMLTGHVFQ